LNDETDAFSPKEGVLPAMETKERHPEQTDLASHVRGPARPARGSLGKLTLVAFLGYAFMYFVVFFYILLVARRFIPPIVIEASLILIAAGVVATRWRWAPAFGAVVALLTLYDPLFQPHNVYVYAHPAEAEFRLLILLDAFGLVALLSSIWATVQNVRRAAPRLPRFSPIALSGLGGIVVGMMIVSQIAATVPQPGTTGSGPNGEPVVHLTADRFAQNVALVPKGKSLLLVNDSSVEHILQNGAWDASGSAHPQVESGAPTLRNVDITSGSTKLRTKRPFSLEGSS
jgi:hypothetical protein